MLVRLIYPDQLSRTWRLKDYLRVLCIRRFYLFITENLNKSRFTEDEIVLVLYARCELEG